MKSDSLVLAIVVCIAWTFLCAAKSSYAEEPPKDKADVTVQIPRFGSPAFMIDIKQVQTVYAEVFYRPFDGPKTIDRFEMPIEIAKELLKVLDNCEVDPHPAPYLPQLGCLTLVSADGYVQQIAWYWPLGKGRLRLSAKGVRLIEDAKKWDGLDSGAGFTQRIMEIHKEVVGQQKTAKP